MCQRSSDADGLLPHAVDVPPHDDVANLLRRPIAVRDDRARRQHHHIGLAAIAHELVDDLARDHLARTVQPCDAKARTEQCVGIVERKLRELSPVQPERADILIPRKELYEAVLCLSLVVVELYGCGERAPPIGGHGRRDVVRARGIGLQAQPVRDPHIGCDRLHGREVCPVHEEVRAARDLARRSEGL
jgi:hypothetical protein